MDSETVELLADGHLRAQGPAMLLMNQFGSELLQDLVDIGLTAEWFCMYYEHVEFDGYRVQRELKDGAALAFLHSSFRDEIRQYAEHAEMGQEYHDIIWIHMLGQYFMMYRSKHPDAADDFARELGMDLPPELYSDYNPGADSQRSPQLGPFQDGIGALMVVRQHFGPEAVTGLTLIGLDAEKVGIYIREVIQVRNRDVVGQRVADYIDECRRAHSS